MVDAAVGMSQKLNKSSITYLVSIVGKKLEFDPMV